MRDLPGEAEVWGFCLPGVWVWVPVTPRWWCGQGRFLCWSEGAAEPEVTARISKLGLVIPVGYFGQKAVRVGRSALLCCAVLPDRGRGLWGGKLPQRASVEPALPRPASPNPP